MEMQFKNEIKKLADIVVWADALITAGGYNDEKYRDDASTAYCCVKAYELWKIKTVVLDSMERHTVYTNALNKDIADKAAKIDLLEKEIEGRKEGYYALKDKMDVALANKDEKAKELINISTKEISELKKELADCKVKIRHQKENLDGINKTLEIRTKENESLIKVRNNQDREIEAHEAENARLSERIMEKNESINTGNEAIINLRKQIGELKEEIKSITKSRDIWFETAGTHSKTILEQSNTIAKKNKEIEKLKVDLVHEREKNEKLARAHAELENDMRKSYTDIIIEKEDDHGRTGFKKYIEWLIEEEERAVPERFKARLNEEITEIFTKEEETEVKGVGRTSSGRYPWGDSLGIREAVEEDSKKYTPDFPCGSDSIE